MKILLTGAAGFIGMTTSLRLLARGDEVVGLDNLNDYYDVTLKQRRLDRLTPSANFQFVKMDVADRAAAANPAYDPVQADPATSSAPYRVFNIGNNNPVPLLDFIACIEDALGKKAEKRLLPLQDGDVPATYANTDALRDWVGFVPGTSIQDGIARFVAWYRDYYKV